MEADGQGIDDLDLLDARLQRLGPGPLVALEAELHVLGGDRVAVVELEPAAELELVDPPVRAFLPRLRQARAHLLPRQRAKQRIVDRIEQPERGDLGRRSEEHTSELQSLTNLVCRLLLEKKK